MSKIYILSSIGEEIYRPLTDYINNNYSEGAELIVATPQSRNVFIRHVSCAWYFWKKTHNGDSVVSMFDYQGILLWWICKLTFTRRKILAINILHKGRTTAGCFFYRCAHRLHDYLFQKALKDVRNIRATVTSTHYGEWISKQLNIDVKFFLLRDCNYWFYKADETFAVEEKQNTVFCGGYNGRDWELVTKLVKGMPDVRFILMPGNKFFDSLNSKIGDCKNAKIYRSVGETEFMSEQLSASIIIMPLKVESPAGLIVVFQSANNKKFVVVSKNVTMEEYVTNERGGILGDDLNEWKETIYHYLNHPEERKKCAEELHGFILKECSMERYCNTILESITSDFNSH